ncbi:MAG: ABC transporter ATP-binding protein [Sporichthyaceae bacterium]
MKRRSKKSGQKQAPTPIELSESVRWPDSADERAPLAPEIPLAPDHGHAPERPELTNTSPRAAAKAADRYKSNGEVREAGEERVGRIGRFLDGFAPEAEGDGLVAEAQSSTLRSMIKRFWPDVRPFRWGIVGMLLLAVLAPLIQTAQIWLFQRIIDDVLVPTDLGAMYDIALLYLLLSIGGGIVGWVDSYLGAWVGEHLLLRIRSKMLRRLQRANTTTLDKMRAGDLLTRLTDDVGAVESLMVGIVVSATGSIAQLLFFGTALFLLDWRLALLSLTVVPFFWLIAATFARKLKRIARQRARRAGSLTAVAEESLAVLALVQVHGREKEEAARFDREANAVLATELSASRLTATFPLVVDFVELLGMLAVIAAGAWALDQGNLTLGGLLVFLTYLTKMYGPVRSLGDLGNTIVSAMADVDRIEEVLKIEDGVVECPDPVALNTAATVGRMELREVTFWYPGAHRPAVSKLSYTFEPGRMTALSGPSGSGKSTLVRLLARLDDPDDGVVLLDGYDLRILAARGLRDTVTVLLQEAPVLDSTVRDNLTFAKPGAEDSEVWAALRLAGVDDVIAALPKGLNSRLGQRGRSLSGGQRQRIALARALMTGAKVLILDEPTTGLDDVTAQRFLSTLRELSTERTIIVSSHDAVVLAEADEVLHLVAPEAPPVSLFKRDADAYGGEYDVPAGGEDVGPEPVAFRM